MIAQILRPLLLASFCSGSATADIALRDDVPDPLRQWSFEYGLAFITHDKIEQVALGRTSIADGPSGGQMHLLTAAYRLAEPTWLMGNHEFNAIAWATPRRPNLALAKAAYPLPPRRLAVAPVKKIDPWPRGTISRAASRPVRNPP